MSSQKNTDSQELVSMIDPRWFKASAEHSLIGPTGKASPHLFFDLSPEFSQDNRLANVIITTPEASAHKYQLDLLSGQSHFAYSYCKNLRPAFSIGHIPRVLDQLGTPQKVLVFGGAKKFNEAHRFNPVRVKFVGAYVERFCPQGDCDLNGSWLSRLVFLSVDPDDERYRQVNELPELLAIVDWDDMQDLLENMDGKNPVGVRSYPYLKTSAPLSYEDAFKFFKDHAIFFSDGELKKIQSGCVSLYEKLWTEVGVERPEDRPVQNMEESKVKRKLRESLKARKMPVGFVERFIAFSRKYYETSVTCSKFVYAGNINLNPEKFWFLNQVQLFYRLHGEGLYFDCHHQSWQKNVIDTQGNPVYDFKRGIGKCDAADIDAGMGYMQNFLEGLKSGGDEYFRFVDYDNHVFGTHNKLYSWVKVPSKKFECGENAEIKKKLEVFPDDVKWKPRKLKDYESEMKIIY